jgi:hypothetical protein
MRLINRFLNHFHLNSSLINRQPLDYKHHVRSYPDGVLEHPQVRRIEKRLADFYRPHNRRLLRLLDYMGHREAAAEIKTHFTL